MKGRGLILGLSLLVLILVPNPAIQTIARILLFMLVASAWISQLSKRKIELSPEFSEYYLFAHERQKIRIWVRNRSPIAIKIGGFKDESGGLHCPDESQRTFSLGAHEQLQLSYTVWSERRGLYTLGPVYTSGLDPLGFFPWQREFALPRPLVVFPRIVEADIELARGILGSAKSSRWLEHRNPLETRALRKYQEGDDFRSIHWKQSARTATIMVREYPLERDVPILILLNLRASDFAPKRKHAHIERCIEACTALLTESFRQNYTCRFSALARVLDREGTQNTKYQPASVRTASAADHGITQTLSLLALMTELTDHVDLREILGAIPVHDRPYLIFISPPLSIEDHETFMRFAAFTKNPRFIMMDEQSDRSSCVCFDQASSWPGLSVWRLYEQHNDAGEIYVPQ